MSITWVGSPNHTAGRGGEKISGIIIHWMVGTLSSTDSIFQNRKRNTSAHYGVEDDRLHQYVAEENTAYHAGNWDVNQRTIGIEHSAGPGRAPSDATYESSAQLIAAIAKRHGLAINSSTVRPHNAIIATQCSGEVSNGGVDIERLIRRANELLGAPTKPQQPAQPPAQPINVAGTATVTVDTLMVRSQPSTSAPLSGSQKLTRGQTFKYTEAVRGQSISGISTWLKSTKGNYLWAGGTDYPTTPVVPQGGVARAIRITNVRSAPRLNAPLAGSRQLQAGNTFEYSAIVTGDTVSQNGITSNRWYHSKVGNYVWAGNVQSI